jgi:spore germination cell wall hydrolase CwlJ-like protein
MPSFNKKTLKILSSILVVIVIYCVSLSYAKERIEDTAMEYTVGGYEKVESVKRQKQEILQKQDEIIQNNVKKEKQKYLSQNSAAITCLADNIYYEAGNEPRKGKIAVAGVTLNRVRNPKYPSNVCSVVYQRTSRVCQFSWTCMRRPAKDPVLYAEAKDIAKKVLTSEINTRIVVNSNVLFYHADYVSPGWKLQRVTKIGRHIFYAG